MISRKYWDILILTSQKHTLSEFRKTHVKFLLPDQENSILKIVKTLLFMGFYTQNTQKLRFVTSSKTRHS